MPQSHRQIRQPDASLNQATKISLLRTMPRSNPSQISIPAYELDLVPNRSRLVKDSGAIPQRRYILRASDCVYVFMGYKIRLAALLKDFNVSRLHSPVADQRIRTRQMMHPDLRSSRRHSWSMASSSVQTAAESYSALSMLTWTVEVPQKSRERRFTYFITQARVSSSRNRWECGIVGTPVTSAPYGDRTAVAEVARGEPWIAV